MAISSWEKYKFLMVHAAMQTNIVIRNYTIFSANRIHACIHHRFLFNIFFTMSFSLSLRRAFSNYEALHEKEMLSNDVILMDTLLTFFINFSETFSPPSHCLFPQNPKIFVFISSILTFGVVLSIIPSLEWNVGWSLTGYVMQFWEC